MISEGALVRLPSGEWLQARGPARWQTEPGARPSASFYLPTFFLPPGERAFLIFDDWKIGTKLDLDFWMEASAKAKAKGAAQTQLLSTSSANQAGTEARRPGGTCEMGTEPQDSAHSAGTEPASPCDSLAANTKTDSSNASWQQPDYSEFLADITQIKNLMKEGKIQKLVPVVFESRPGSLPPEKITAVLEKLSRTPVGLFPYGFWSGGQGLLGASPEILFNTRSPSHRGSGTELYTMALAGTAPLSRKAHEFLTDRKERREHEYVVADLLDKLSGWGRAVPSKTKVLRLPQLQHLLTEITVQVTDNMSFLELIRTLHPTPALGSVPREEGLEWLKRQSSATVRKRFGAPFGVVLPDDQGALVLVAIRNIQWDEQSCLIGSGCGIVAASDAEKEWQELILKRQSVKAALGLK